MTNALQCSPIITQSFVSKIQWLSVVSWEFKVLLTFCFNFSDVTWMSWHLNHWPLNCLCNSWFILTKNNISKIHITGHLWVEATGHLWIPLRKGQQCRKLLLWGHNVCCLIHIRYITRHNQTWIEFINHCICIYQLLPHSHLFNCLAFPQTRFKYCCLKLGEKTILLCLHSLNVGTLLYIWEKDINLH